MSTARETVPLADLLDDVMAFVTEVVYCTVTTVDPRGRPRSRVMHPIFERLGDDLSGWALTDRSPVKTRHLAANPYVSCSYWSPAQNTVAIDCRAAWVDEADEPTRRHVWDVFAHTPAPLGWGDLSAYEPEGIHHPLFQPLRLVPWRVAVLRADQLAAGDVHPRVWRAQA